MSRKKISIRRARPDDAGAIAALMDEPAVFANLMQMPYASEEGQRARIADSLLPGKTDLLLVAERDGRIVGQFLLYRRPPDLRVPRESIDLGQASTDPAARGTGVGRALTAHVIRWAHENGYPAMTTDWRMTNLLASRFWPKRGFRPTFLRLYRSIP